MHEQRHNNHINGVLVIIATIVVGGILWYFIASSGDTYTATPIDVKTDVIPDGGEELYRNDTYEFSLRYDSRFDVLPVSAEDAWRQGVILEGGRLLTLLLPRTEFPGTNFSEAIVTVGARGDEESLAGCLVPQDGEVLKGKGPNQMFTVFASSGAGAGNFYDVESHRMVRDGACIAVDRMIHSTNILNYDESMNISEFDRGAVDDIINRVIASFRFIS